MPPRGFQPGHTGRPKGARNKLQLKFLLDLQKAWEEHGEACLRIMVKEEPSKFVTVIAGLMPRELELAVGGPLSEMSDDELAATLEAVKQLRARTIDAVDDAPPKPKRAPQLIEVKRDDDDSN